MKLKIGVICYPSMGGSGILATELGHELALRGHEVHFITYDIPFRLKLNQKNIFFHRVKIQQYDLFKYPDYALALSVKIAQVSEEYDLDLLHVHYAIPHATSAYLAKKILGQKSPKIITTLHGTDITLVGKDAAYFQIVKFSIEQSDGVTAVSYALKHQTQQYFKIDKPIEVIHNFFIPKAELKDKKPLKELFIDKEQKLLLHSSNYRKIKNPLDVVKIFDKVNKVVPSRLLFLGWGSGIDEVKRLVMQKKIEKEVFFWGKNKDIDPYVASADLFLLPSSQESFGLAVLEAMAYGVPAVASNVGGLPELIENKVSGYLSEVGDIDKMAKDAIYILTHPEEYVKMSREAAKQAKEKFSMERIVGLYEEYYKSLFRDHKSRTIHLR